MHCQGTTCTRLFEKGWTLAEGQNLECFKWMANNIFKCKMEIYSKVKLVFYLTLALYWGPNWPVEGRSRCRCGWGLRCGACLPRRSTCSSRSPSAATGGPVGSSSPPTSEINDTKLLAGNLNFWDCVFEKVLSRGQFYNILALLQNFVIHFLLGHPLKSRNA